MRSTFNARNAIFSQIKSGIFQNPILNEPFGCMRPQKRPELWDRVRTGSGQGQDKVRTGSGQGQDRVRTRPGQGQDRVRTGSCPGLVRKGCMKQNKGGLFRENPFGPKTCQGKPLRGNVFDGQKRSRRPKGKPLNKFWCGNNTFLVPGPFSPPKRNTSERKSFWHKNVFSGVWKTMKLTKFEMLWEKALGTQI